METIEGNVERITYYNPENGYCVMRLAPSQLRLGGRDQLITVVGNMPELQPGENVRLSGEWTFHPRHGKQFKTETVVQERPATVEGIKRYLGSGLISNVGKGIAEKIVDHFGEKTLDILDRQPDQLLQVPGVGKKRAQNIAKAWAEQQEIKRVMLFLQSHNIKTALALRIYREYGDNALEQVQEDPYRMVKDIHGVGFRTADRIARAIGMPAHAPARVRAGLVHALNEARRQGHVYLPTEELIAQSAELLEIEQHLIETELDGMHGNDDIVMQDIPDPENGAMRQVVYYSMMHSCEEGTAKRFFDLMYTPDTRLKTLAEMTPIEWETVLAEITSRDGISLSEQQATAVRTTLTNKVSVLTGGPGTGKTTTLRTIIAMLKYHHCRFELASPTGRAARRLADATGHEAQTLHRLLKFSPAEGFTINQYNTLDTDIVIVDEASMVDLLLFYSLIRALKPDTHLLLVGDVDQLPSVGAGDVLRDVIRSKICPVIRLDTVFRQASESKIIENAHLINQGKTPDTSNTSSDFFFFGESDPAAAADLLVDVVNYRIPRKFGFDAIADIQVLSPMYNGSIGVNALNHELQKVLNPSGNKPEQSIHGAVFREGDKVMQTRNNYDKEVYNGDIGRIQRIDMENRVLQVKFEANFDAVNYDWIECDEIVHAYAISVHKSQGAEYPVVVMPILTQHYMMLQRNLLYTAVTRARKMVVLVGSRKAIAIAVRNDKLSTRYSALAWRLAL
jgi:exodeoxyribonuclease V alpha subunit